MEWSPNGMSKPNLGKGTNLGSLTFSSSKGCFGMDRKSIFY